MIIYIYQGMMALGRGGESIMGGELRGETQRGGWVRSVRRTWDEINAYQRVAPTEFSLIFSIFKESPAT